jgi:hypothetical protein
MTGLFPVALMVILKSVLKKRDAKSGKIATTPRKNRPN